MFIYEKTLKSVSEIKENLHKKWTNSKKKKKKSKMKEEKK